MERAKAPEAAQPRSPLPSLSDLEERMKMLNISALEENQAGDTFAQRAEWFYQRRPLLLSLLRDLYNGYTTLLDRLNRTKSHPLNIASYAHQHRDEESSDTDAASEISSEVESTLSFQQMQGIAGYVTADTDDHCLSRDTDEMVLQLLTTNLDKDILRNELLNTEQQCHEASKIIELLKKVVELLEMEKEMALKENASLGYKLTSLLEENRELAAEALFMKKEAVGLARCVLRMRDDHFHRICALQNRVYALQASRNYHHAAQEPSHELASAGCFGLEKHKAKKKKKNETRTKIEANKGFKWLKQLKNINVFTKCSLNPSTAPPCCTQPA